MAIDSEFKGLVEGDLGKLKLVLKAKLASLEEIKHEEESLVETMRRLIGAIKSMETTLENEVQMFKKIRSGWEKAYMEKRWAAIANALRQEIAQFNAEYKKTKDIYGSADGLIKRFERLRETLKKMNAANAESLNLLT